MMRTDLIKRICTLLPLLLLIGCTAKAPTPAKPEHNSTAEKTKQEDAPFLVVEVEGRSQVYSITGKGYIHYRDSFRSRLTPLSSATTDWYKQKLRAVIAMPYTQSTPTNGDICVLLRFAANGTNQSRRYVEPYPPEVLDIVTCLDLDLRGVRYTNTSEEQMN